MYKCFPLILILHLDRNSTYIPHNGRFGVFMPILKRNGKPDIFKYRVVMCYFVDDKYFATKVLCINVVFMLVMVLVCVSSVKRYVN